MLHIEKANSAFLKITGDTNDKMLVSSYFRKPVKDYFFMPKFKAGMWDGHIKFFNSTTGFIPYGLYGQLFDFIESAGIEFSCSEEVIEELTPLVVDMEILEKIFQSIKIDVQRREYQFRGAKAVLESKRGMLEHGTGAGKTVTLYLIINYLLIKGIKKFIFIVPTISLLHQTYNDFKAYGFPVEKYIGKYYGDEKDGDKPIVFGTWQSLCKNKALLKSARVVTCDEVHLAKAQEITKLMEKCSNADYRIGVTGTIPDWITDAVSVEGSFGPILDTMSVSKLIHEEKVLAPVKIKVLNIKYPKSLSRGIKSYIQEREIIESYDFRKEVVKSILTKFCAGQNTLLIFDKVEFGEDYFNYMKAHIPESTFYWISGKVKGEIREEIRLLTNEGIDVKLFGTAQTVATGMNIPKLHNVLFIYIGKSFTRVSQAIGRGGRKHAEKDLATIYDISDDLKYGKRHLIERLKIYAKAGYPVEIHDIGEKG